ncbi:TPA: hypothetical protein LLS62_003655 [Klebsiella michiganensis]|nr:hypothetical protein [Klebsiella michiganensis]
MDKNLLKIGCGIIGSEIITTRENGDCKTVEITTTGSMNSHNIPAVIVFCEDKLTKDIITHSLHAIGEISHYSFKFIINGSWKNIITSLAGSLLYADELKKTGNTKVISTVGVIDGDITETQISTVISKCYEGDFLPDNLKDIRDSIKEHLTSFRLPDYIINKKNTTGRPELNIKKMLEEINEESIDSVLGQRIKELNLHLKKSSDNESKQILKNEIYFLEKEAEDTPEIIKISKNISSKKFKTKEKNGTYKLNYHSYLNKLASELSSRHFVTYGTGTPPPLLLIYRLVNKYNQKRWLEYVGPVLDFLTPIAKEQRERFSHNTYNDKIIS